MPSTAPLENLYLSKLNVRKTEPEIDIPTLANDLAAKGLLQNLVVVPHRRKKNKFGVVAGGRRLAALRLLEERGDWPASIDRAAIPVEITTREEGRAASLAENIQHVPMNPADEYEGFRDILADYEREGESDHFVRIERCARHFGKPVRYVEQRLRLANLAPDILDALRQGRISVDVAKAYAAVSDHALQMQVFASQRLQSHHSVAGIRAALAGRVYRTSDRQVRYVGVDRYVAAGGRVELDLFMGSEDGEQILDTALLDRLCQEQADAEAAQLARARDFAGGAVWPWGSNSHSTWPKTPAGFAPRWQVGGCLSLEARAEAIAIFQIAGDGDGLILTDKFFAPIAAARPGEAPAPAPGSSAPRAGESEIERLGRIRRDKVRWRALQLALPPLAGTPLDGRTFWPREGVERVGTVQEDEESYVVALLVRIPKQDVEPLTTAAELMLDQEEAARDAAAPADAGESELAGAEAADDRVLGEAVE